MAKKNLGKSPLGKTSPPPKTPGRGVAAVIPMAEAGKNLPRKPRKTETMNRPFVGSGGEEIVGQDLPKDLKIRRFVLYKNRPERWVPLFLDDLEQNGLVRHACQVAGITFEIADSLRKQDPAFASDWEDALETSTEILELAARERAVAYSDTLMALLLKANNPEKFGDKVTMRVDNAISKMVRDMAEKMGVDPNELIETIRQLQADTIEGSFSEVVDG